MTPPRWDYDAFAERVREWAAQQSDVRAALVFGSRARDDRPADVWSDLDVVFVTTAADHYIDTTDWLDSLGDPWLTSHGTTPVGDFTELHVLLDDGIEVDVVPLDRDAVVPVADIPDEVLAVLTRGYEFLVDKDGLAEPLAARLDRVDSDGLLLALPANDEFVDTVQSAWYYVFWVAKKLRRGELWSAKRGLDGYLKWECLLPILTWHARAVHGRRSWHAGRFLEEWADERALDDLDGAFADYDEADCWRALGETVALFRWLARETADAAGYDYPATADDQVTDLVEMLRPDGAE